MNKNVETIKRLKNKLKRIATGIHSDWRLKVNWNDRNQYGYILFKIFKMRST